ncbi:two-component system sensor histidine kinase NtrB [Candidatus Nitrospira bockiana]
MTDVTPNGQAMEDLRIRLYWLMGFRVVVVTLLLGLSTMFQIGKSQPVLTFFPLIAITYALTVAYALALRYLLRPALLPQFAYLQVVVDLLLETYLVAKTGGIESPFSVFYIITVTLANLILRRQGGLMAAGVSVILFGVVTNLQLSGGYDMVPATRLSPPATIYTFGVHSLAVIVVGLLSGALADQLKRAGQSLVEKEQGLSRLQAFHENVVESLSSGLFTTDETGRITSFNRAARDITQYSAETVLGKPWWEVFNWEQANLFDADTSTVVAPFRFEGEGRRADNTRMIIGMTLAPLTENGIRTGLVGVFQDLTQIRDLEEQMRRREWLATLGEMSAGMAHEIRNPLAALAGSMQMLQKDLSLDEANRHLMDIAIRETARLDSIITEFLLYARPPALNLKECDVNGVLADTLDLIRHEAQSHMNIVIVTYPGPGSMTAQIDPDQIKQVFWNLATNAFEAMPAGGQLTISTRRRRVGSAGRSGEVIEISFQDTGEGIKKERLDKIFLPFFTTKKRGSGLGLAAVHRIVDLHGGWIRVESQEGKGSQFIVCLPVSADSGLRLWHEGREPWKRS